MAQKYDISNSLLGRKVNELVENGQWPMYTVTPTEFLEASRLLIQLSDCVADRKIDGKQIKVEVLADMASEATVTMVKCIQKMELEASYREMDSKLRWAEGVEHSFDFLKAQEFVELSKSWLFQYNNRAYDDMAAELEVKGIRPRYIDAENVGTFELDMQKEFTEEATKNHSDAMQLAYDEIENLIKYGLPSSSAAGKVKDAFMLSDTIKEKNQTIVDKILQSEADLEIVNLYIVPALQLQIQEYHANAVIEASHYKEPLEKIVGEARDSDPYYFRRNYKLHVDALEAINNALRVMEEREKAMESDYKVSFEKDKKTSTYNLVAKYSNGGKTSIEIKPKDLPKNVTVTTTKEKNSIEREIRIRLGKQSRRIYEEIRKRSAQKLGFTKERIRQGKKRSLKSIFSFNFLKRSKEIKKNYGLDGKKSYSATAEVDPIKVEAKVVGVTQNNKEHTIIGASAGIGNASIGFENKNHIPSVNASVKTAQASAQVTDYIKTSVSAGTIGYDTRPDLVGHVKEKLFEQTLGNEQNIGEAAKEFAESTLKKPINVSTGVFKAGVSVAGLDIMSAKYKDGGIETKNRIPEIKNAAVQVGQQVQQTLSDIEQAYNDMQVGIADEITQGAEEQPIITEEPSMTYENESYELAENEFGQSEEIYEQEDIEIAGP